MKKKVIFLTVFSLFAIAFSSRPVMAQEKVSEEQEKEYKIQRAIEEQKKAMADQKKTMEVQKKAQEEALKSLEEASEDLDSSLKNFKVDVQIDDPDDPEGPVRARIKRIDRAFHFDEPFVWTSKGDPLFLHTYDSNNESTSWQFSKRIKEKSLKNEYTFDVEKTSNSVVMSVMGDCKEGEIRIKIIMPNGKTYSDVVIDEFGNLNWRKSFSISETENQDKTGPWKFLISSNKASGYFKISLEAY
jgi:uncharacterized FlaG/YvyC family protein